MFKYVLKRLLWLVPVLFGVTILVFVIMHVSPGDPAQILLGPKATQEALAQLRAELGLDKPLHIQYLTWIGNVLKGDWGRSLQLKREVLPLVLDRFGATAILTLTSIILATVVGVLAGTISAARQYSWLDRSMMFISLVGFCLPVFWLGLLLQLLFGLKLEWLPMTGMYSVGSEGSFGDLLLHLILPSVTLAAGAAATISRMTRSSMLEVIRQDYIRTAKAKGLADKVVVFRHALKNALIPVTTVVGMQVGSLLAGAVLAEMVFSWPGIGNLMVNGILARDFPLVQGSILLVAASYVLVNLIVDVLYAFLDPKIAYS